MGLWHRPQLLEGERHLQSRSDAHAQALKNCIFEFDERGPLAVGRTAPHRHDIAWPRFCASRRQGRFELIAKFGVATVKLKLDLKIGKLQWYRWLPAAKCQPWPSEVQQLCVELRGPHDCWKVSVILGFAASCSHPSRQDLHPRVRSCGASRRHGVATCQVHQVALAITLLKCDCLRKLLGASYSSWSSRDPRSATTSQGTARRLPRDPPETS